MANSDDRSSRLDPQGPVSRLGARFHFTDVPAEMRERIIEELKRRPEFEQVFEAAVSGASVSLALRTPEAIEFTYGDRQFTGFAWMGQIYVLGTDENG